MNCPKCNGKSKVFDTRSAGWKVYRRRECKECGFEFWTLEQKVNSAFASNESYKIWQGKYKKTEDKS